MFNRFRPSPAMFIASVALVIALGGSAYAVTALPKNSVGPKQLKNNAVTGAKVKNNSLTGADINESKLGVVPNAITAASALTVPSSALAPEAVHYVRPQGDCANDFGAFCSLGWTNYGNGYAPVGYRKDSGGWVHLQGVADAGVANGVIFVLPPGYRPSDGIREFPALRCGAAQTSWIDVKPSGDVKAGAACITLDGIVFHP